MRVLAVVAVAVLIATVAGCGTPPGGPPAPAAGTSPAGPNTGPPPAPAADSPELTWFQTGGVSGIFDARSARRITIENPLGDIAVSPGQGETITVTVRLHALAQDEAATKSRTKEVSLGTSVKENEFLLTLVGGGDDTFAALEITIPTDRDVTLDASAGKAVVQGLRGAVTIAGTVGDIAVTDVRGPLSIHTETASVAARGVAEGATVYTSSGAIELTDIAGPLIARTMTGEIHLLTTSNEIVASTQSGNIDLRVTHPLDGALEARTDSGSIEVRVPPTSSCRVTTMTRSGEITSELPLKEVTRKGVNIAGRLGAGKGTLLATTGSGSILLAPVE